MPRPKRPAASHRGVQGRVEGIVAQLCPRWARGETRALGGGGVRTSLKQARHQERLVLLNFRGLALQLRKLAVPLWRRICLVLRLQSGDQSPATDKYLVDTRSYVLFDANPAAALVRRFWERPERSCSFVAVCSIGHPCPLGASTEPLRVVGGGVTSTTLAGTPESVGEVRAWLRSVLTLRGTDTGAIADAALVLSELASNAVVHSRSGLPGGTYTVALHCESSRVRITVTDRGSHRQSLLTASKPCETPLAENGRGLLLVDHHATAWWATHTTEGHTVTADIPTTRTRTGVES